MKKFIALVVAVVAVNKIIDNRNRVVASRSHQPAQKSVERVSKIGEQAPEIHEDVQYTPQPEKGHLKLDCTCTEYCYCGNCLECYGGGGGECNTCSSD